MPLFTVTFENRTIYEIPDVEAEHDNEALGVAVGLIEDGYVIHEEIIKHTVTPQEEN